MLDTSTLAATIPRPLATFYEGSIYDRTLSTDNKVYNVKVSREVASSTMGPRGQAQISQR